MNKKTLTVVIIVLAVAIVGSVAYYGFNRWRQERIVSKYFQELYGTGVPGVGGLLGGGGGGVSADTLTELAKLQAEADAKAAAEEAARIAAEANKTPAQKYDEAAAAYLTGDVSSLYDQVAKSQIESVFGKAKIIASTVGYYGVGGFAVQLMVPEKLTPEQFEKLVNKFTDEGYQSIYGEITATNGMVMLQKEETTASMTLGYDVTSGEQAITVMYAVNE